MSSPAPEGRKTMTQAAIEANRRNAQKSTGPKTTEGKAKSRMNAAKHYGYALKIDPLLPTENPDQYEQFSQSLFDMYRPKTCCKCNWSKCWSTVCGPLTACPPKNPWP